MNKKIMSFESFLSFEFRNMFNRTNHSLKQAIDEFDELKFPNQKIFLRFYLYYLFQVNNRRISKKEYLIIKDYLDEYPEYQDVVDLYKKSPDTFVDIIKNLRNYDLYKNKKETSGIILKSFRKVLEDKTMRINFIKNTKISSSAVSRFRSGIDYAISFNTFSEDRDFIKKARDVFWKLQKDNA